MMLKVIASVVTFAIFLFYIVIPLIAQLLSSFRLRATFLSPLSARGLEWRSKYHASAAVPTLRIERVHWSWGGCTPLVLRIEGVTFHLRSKKEEGEKIETKKIRMKLPVFVHRAASFILHLILHHWSSLATLVTIQVSDVRIILEDLESVQIVVSELSIGMKIDFAVPESFDDSIEETAISPPPSPLVEKHNSIFPQESAHASRLSHLHRRASDIPLRMASTASQVWSRAIGRAHGRVSFHSVISNVSIIQPNLNPSLTGNLAHSLPHSMQSTGPGYSKSPRSPSFNSFGPINSFLKSRLAVNTPSTEGIPAELLVIQKSSTVSISLGFGPKRGLLGEDTLRVAFHMGALRVSLNAIEKLQEIFKTGPSTRVTKATSDRWKPTATPRVVLRAFESASISFAQVLVSHDMPVVSRQSSASSLSPDVTSSAAVDTASSFKLSVELTNVCLKLSAADSRNHTLARNAFGSNTSPTCKVRGIGFNVQWSGIELQCIAPGETSNDKTEIIAIRQGEIDGLSTWRPSGWTRDELLFSSDLDLSLVVVHGSIASIDVAGEIQLFDEIVQLWMHDRPVRQTMTASTPTKDLPPRVRLFVDIGHISVVVANRASHDNATMTLASDGVSIGCFTSNTELVASRRNTLAKESTSSVTLYDDLAVSLKADASISIEPITLGITLGARNEKTYRLATIGRLTGAIAGDIRGRQFFDEDGIERYQLDRQTLTANVDVGIDGVKAELWNTSVIDALVSLGGMKEPHAKTMTSSPLKTLPSGVSARLSLGAVGVFVGHQDPNPNCDLRLSRGLWLQSTIVVDYAHYANKAQTARCRHILLPSSRKKLELPDDITTQALAFTNDLEKNGGEAALISLSLHDITVRPVFNGDHFIMTGGVDHRNPHEQVEALHPPNENTEFVAWESLAPKPAKPRVQGPFHTNRQLDVGLRSLVRMPHVLVNWLVHQPRADAEITHKITTRLHLVHLVADVATTYCALLAAQTVFRLVDSVKRPPPPTKVPERISVSRFSISAFIPKVWVHLSFPLEDQLFISLSSVNIKKHLNDATTVTTNHALIHVPSPKHIGSWEELGRLKTLNVSLDLSHTCTISAEALRIRIPYAYILYKLILNINIAVKALKLLVENLRTGHFATYKPPLAELPKKVPSINICIGIINLEARDHPVETNINLACRVGLMEQRSRIALEDTFMRKINILSEAPELENVTNLTTKQSVSLGEARYRLDWYMSRNWVKRIRRAKEEQRRRETTLHRSMQIDTDAKLPISVVPSPPTTPLFRASLKGVDISVTRPALDREQIIQYMGDVSSPFVDDVQFSLMIPFELKWTMAEAKFTLRDYPLPLIQLPATEGKPSWCVTTLFVIAEELAGEDSCIYIPCEVIPEACGHSMSKPLLLQIAKTINPVKTYARPIVKVLSPAPTNVTWCNSYQPGISDLTRVIETLSHPPRDPSPRVGFWDKFRLVLHWQVTMDFAGTVRLNLKGSSDPYAVTGHGAGFSLVFRRNVHAEIGRPNEQWETIQIMADELLISIPDLDALHDAAALGNEVDPSNPNEADRLLIERRSTKPCARFLNGIRFGLGFRFERTCRPWTCNSCGATDNLLHRQCRLFEFRPHQAVILRSPEALKRAQIEAGHPIDSYEGFRSDYIHFSVSLVAPKDSGAPSSGCDAETHSSVHLSPKAFAHFFAWWKLFVTKVSTPIRQGKAFPETPPPSRKFGKSLATIKYRCDLAPLYVSHIYDQVSKDLWDLGCAQNLGLKLRVDRFRADAHQRMQEKREWNERLNRTKTVVHKPFYAADLLLDQIRVIGIVADFDEKSSYTGVDTSGSPPPNESKTPPDLREWYNFFDFIDADRKPFDRKPQVQVVNLGDCPHVFLSRRVKARLTKSTGDSEARPNDMEASKFGHEKSHVCYLGAAQGVGPMQMHIARERVSELQDILSHLPEPTEAQRRNPRDFYNHVRHRINTLNHHIDDLAHGERRHIDDNTLQAHDMAENAIDDNGELTFENTIHVHCPRIFFNNESRNLVYKYWYSRNDRQREEYTGSYASLRSVRDGINRRMKRIHTGLNQDDFFEPQADKASSVPLLEALENMVGDKNTKRFKLSPDFFSDRDNFRKPAQGIPMECKVKPRWRMLVLKPQIALRSEADPNAIVLVAVKEIAFKGFAIVDAQGLDPVTMDVLSRNYVALKDLQVFYPTEETLRRERGGTNGVPRHLDFVPLEIFLDVNSEETDYERVVLKTDTAVSFDKFNHLRMPRGLEWPEAVNDNGEPMDHLRKHQNLTSIVVPMVTVAATSNHYTSLYYIVTDLLNYRDPQQVVRSDKIENFMLTFDRKDRDPQQLLAELFLMQHNIRSLGEIQRGYERNVIRLSDEGKRELFRIRTDLLDASEGLFTVFEAINLNQAREDAKAALKTHSRLDVRAGNIAWHMLRDNGDPLIKLNLQHTLFSVESNKNGSSDSGLIIGDLQALNSNADAQYWEVLTRHNKVDALRRKVKSGSFISVSLSFLPPVGGISIVREFGFFLHPVRFRLEERVGHLIVDYIFNDRTKRRKVEGDGQGRQSEGDSRTRPQTLIPSSNVRVRSESVISHESHSAFNSVPDEDAAEMRRRASKNRTFVSIVFGEASFVLDYKSDEHKKHGTFSLPDCVDFRIRAPQMEYHNKVWGFEDIFENVKRDIRSHIWSQTPDILSQLFKKTSVFRSKKNLRHIAGINTDLPSWSPRPSPKSPLRYTIEPPTPLDSDDTPILIRALTTRSDSGEGSPAPDIEILDEDGGEAGVTKTVRGIIDKLRPKHGSRHDLTKETSSDEIRSI